MTRPLHRPTPRPHACSSAGLRRVAAGRGGGGVSAEGGLWRAISPRVRHPQRRELPALPRRMARGAAADHLPRGPHQPWDDHVRVHRGAGESAAAFSRGGGAAERRQPTAWPTPLTRARDGMRVLRSQRQREKHREATRAGPPSKCELCMVEAQNQAPCFAVCELCDESSDGSDGPRVGARAPRPRSLPGRVSSTYSEARGPPPSYGRTRPDKYVPRTKRAVTRPWEPQRAEVEPGAVRPAQHAANSPHDSRATQGEPTRGRFGRWRSPSRCRTLRARSRWCPHTPRALQQPSGR